MNVPKTKAVVGCALLFYSVIIILSSHGLRTPREEIAFTARPKIQSQSQIFRYGRSIFCLPHRPNFSDFFDLCLHWVSVVRGFDRMLPSCWPTAAYCSTEFAFWLCTMFPTAHSILAILAWHSTNSQWYRVSEKKVTVKLMPF